MLETNVNAVSGDMKSLVKDAQALFHSAASLSGDKAEEARNRGLRMLDMAMENIQDAQRSTLAAGKEMAASADGYVKAHPLGMMAVAAGVGLLVGVVVGRNK